VNSESPLEPTRDYVRPRIFTPPSPAELSAQLPDLEVTELLGHGGMGVVYKGRQPFLDRQVAIKLVRPDREMDADSQEQFRREAQLLAKLVHPYIVTVYGGGRAGDLFYLVMEYVDGMSLRQKISAHGLSQADIRDFTPQITEALQYAHDQRVVHCDVKPDNILLDARNRVRLVDFGLSRLLAPSVAKNSSDYRIAGTRSYMAPEQFTMPDRIDHRADIYSTGVVLYEMLTGKVPPGGIDPPPLDFVSNRGFEPVLRHALEPDRERRYQQIKEMNEDVLRVTRTVESTIRLEKHVAAPIEQVFAAWVDAGNMADWYAPTDDYTTPVADVEARVGGKYRVGMQHKDNDFMNLVTGQYSRFEPPYTLQFTWAWETPVPSLQETQVTVEFRPETDGTHLTLIHERFRDQESKRRHTEGWTGCLNRLARKMGK
jgi:serine/threonine protein kinase